jgi:hypothetical protein
MKDTPCILQDIQSVQTSLAPLTHAIATVNILESWRVYLRLEAANVVVLWPFLTHFHDTLENYCDIVSDKSKSYAETERGHIA